MNGADWGKLVARIGAALFAFELIEAVRINGSLLLEAGRTQSERMPVIVEIASTAIFAVGLWVFASRFAPRETRGEADSSVSFGGAVLVAGVAAYALLEYAYRFFEGFASRATAEPGEPMPSMLGLFFDLGACIAFGLACVSSRRIAEWVSR